ncbi:Splicing factor U2AF 65 kDa subunit [Senna tora]|uniref:Splicing factor U2AF 65 kDa subunit n=1 Tax=Senna tora TaxID=362788 RepID=A0A834T6J8_9FABA|nr:Splicing factor U2AF 65 kDa subunit [Senna tora]
MGYQFEIKYKPGKENRVANALSRRGETMELKAYSVWKYDSLEEWTQEVQKDEKLSQVFQQLLTGQNTGAEYSLKNGCLLYKGRLVLPKASTLILRLIKEFHSSPIVLLLSSVFESNYCYNIIHFSVVLSYVDHSVTLKACAGLNGMKLAGEVLTVVQAMPNVSSSEDYGKPPSYEIPEHAKPLLSKPTQVLKIKNVLNTITKDKGPHSGKLFLMIQMIILFIACELSDSSSPSGHSFINISAESSVMRYGTVKSINVVKHSSDRNEATKLEEREVIIDVSSDGASQHFVCDTHNTESSFSEKATYPESTAISEVEFHSGNNAESSIGVDNLEDKSCQREQVMCDTTAVEDKGNKSIPNVISRECPDDHNTSHQSELHDYIVADETNVDIENKMVAGNTDLNHDSCEIPEGFTKLNPSLETKLIGANNGISKEDDICDHVFDAASVLVEYGRTESCCKAAHCFNGRVFDGRMISVEYVALSLYKARFTK